MLISSAEKQNHHVLLFLVYLHLFKRILKEKINNEFDFAIIFDESHNTCKQIKLMDFHIRIWRDMKSKPDFGIQCF